MIEKMTTNLMVEDVDSAVDFYENILNFSTSIKVPGKEGRSQFAILKLNEIDLMLHQRESMIEEYVALATNKVNPSASLYMSVSNFDEFYNDIKSKHSIYIDLHETFYKSMEFSILDIDGYVVTFNDAGVK